MCLTPELKLWERLRKHVSVLAESAYKTQGSRSAPCSEDPGRPQVGGGRDTASMERLSGIWAAENVGQRRRERLRPRPEAGRGPSPPLAGPRPHPASLLRSGSGRSLEGSPKSLQAAHTCFHNSEQSFPQEFHLPVFTDAGAVGVWAK